MKCVLGFDGGGTKTECVLMDESGTILARSRSGPSNPARVGFPATIAALEEAALRALSDAKKEKSSVAAVCAGVAGVQHPNAATKVHDDLSGVLPGAKVAVVTDLSLSLEAAGERPAIVLVAGTGSAAIGWDSEGGLARVGGYGPLVSDQGSAFDIGRQAIVASLREHDETRMDTPLGREILRKLHCPSWREVQERAQTSPDELFPNVFPIVASLADSGDERARKLLSEAAHELARLVGILVKLFGIEGTPFLLAKTGGMVGRSGYFDADIDRRLKQIAPTARIGLLPIAPVEAAASVALQMSKNKASN